MDTEILRPRQVIECLKVSRATLDRWRAKGLFPPPIQLGPTAIGWRRSDVEAWLDSRPEA